MYTYSHFKTERNNVYHRLFLFIGVAIVLLLVVWFWGLTFIQILGFLGTNDNDQQIEQNFSYPLLKPVISTLPDFTNKGRITISGLTSNEVQVTLFVNGLEVGTTSSDSRGNFTFIDITLKDGLNFIKVIARDKSGESKDEKSIITLDKKPPKLEITEPKEGQRFDKTKKITIRGISETDARIFINSIQTTLNQSGNFTYILGVTPGKNKIEIKATDKAGNIEQISLTIFIED